MREALSLSVGTNSQAHFIRLSASDIWTPLEFETSNDIALNLVSGTKLGEGLQQVFGHLCHVEGPGHD